MRRLWNWFGALSSAKQALVVICLFVGLVVVAGIIGASTSGGGDESSAPSTIRTVSPLPPPPPSAPQTATEEGPPPPPPTKAANGDDIDDLHNRAQQAVNRAEICLAALQLATRNTRSAVAMASNLQDARSVCGGSKEYLATENMHGFSDEATTLFASADEGRAATGAGLAYLDTQAPSKLADFRRHVRNASGYFNAGFKSLNARLVELGVPRVKQ